MAVKPAPWPDAAADTLATRVIERAIERNRLSHSLLVTGSDSSLIEQVAHSMADRLLNPPGTPPERYRSVANAAHPDCWELRPAKRMRQIGAEAMRELVDRLKVTPVAGKHKVAIIHECDRMHDAAANIFLKTLEEPPPGTTLLLLTTHPYALLDTIRSRCLQFRFPSNREPALPDGWAEWLGDYQAWLGHLSAGRLSAADATAALMRTYGLIARFESLLAFATAEQWKAQKKHLPPGLAEDEQVAMETGITNGLRLRFFQAIERATNAFARERLADGDEVFRRALADAIASLEHHVSLLRLNLNTSAALEGFLLASLRYWVRKV